MLKAHLGMNGGKEFIIAIIISDAVKDSLFGMYLLQVVTVFPCGREIIRTVAAGPSISDFLQGW